MNRIYQGKVTNVEIVNPDQHAPPIGHRLLIIGHSPQAHAHQLFRDAMNF